MSRVAARFPVPWPSCHTGGVLGPIIIAVIILIAIPVGFLMTMGLVAAVLGTFLKNDADTRYEENTELLTLGEQG